MTRLFYQKIKRRDIAENRKFVGLEEVMIDYKQTYDSILNIIIEDFKKKSKIIGGKTLKLK